MFALRYIHSCLALLETQREMVNAHSCSFFIASLVYIYIYIYIYIYMNVDYWRNDSSP